MNPYKKNCCLMLSLLLFGLIASSSIVAQNLPSRPINFIADPFNVLPPKDKMLLTATLRSANQDLNLPLFVMLWDKPDELGIKAFTHQTLKSWVKNEDPENPAALIAIFMESREIRIETLNFLSDSEAERIVKEVMMTKKGLYKSLEAATDEIISLIPKTQTRSNQNKANQNKAKTWEDVRNENDKLFPMTFYIYFIPLFYILSLLLLNLFISRNPGKVEVPGNYPRFQEKIDFQAFNKLLGFGLGVLLLLIVLDSIFVGFLRDQLIAGITNGIRDLIIHNTSGSDLRSLANNISIAMFLPIIPIYLLTRFIARKQFANRELKRFVWINTIFSSLMLALSFLPQYFKVKSYYASAAGSITIVYPGQNNPSEFISNELSSSLSTFVIFLLFSWLLHFLIVVPSRKKSDIKSS